MHQPTEPPGERQTEAQICCHCGQVTHHPVLVDEVHTASGAGVSVCACPDRAQRYPSRTGRAS